MLKQTVPTDASGVVPFRRDWLFEVVTLLQRAVCQEVFTGDLEGALVGIVSELPPPSNRAEELAMWGLFFHVIAGSRGTGRNAIVGHIRQLTSVLDRPPVLSLAQRVVDQIRRGRGARLQLPRIARALGCDESTLRREFRREYGISPREYHQRLRLQRALEMMAGGPIKTVAIARSVGYSGEAALYKAVRRFTSRTLTSLRNDAGCSAVEVAASLLPLRSGDR